MVDRPRLSALKILVELERRKARIDALLAAGRAKGSLGDLDSAFVSEIVHGVTRWRRALDTIIEKASDRAPDRIGPPVVMALLRMGLYQAAAMSSTPAYAAVSETVALAKNQPQSRRAAGFVNAVLRRAAGIASGRPLRETVEKLLPQGLPDHARLGRIHSFPDWLARRWIKNFGLETAERVMRQSNERAPVFFRLNRLKTSPEDFEKSLEGWGLEAAPVPWARDCYRLTGGRITPESAPVRLGYIQPQDASSIVAAGLLGAAPGETVADACCGKGIKSGAFAQWMENRGTLLLLDGSQARLAESARNMSRLGVRIARPVLADAAAPWPARRPFERIFLDAPCSATGTLRRHPEGKWNKDAGLILEMARLQWEMINRAADSLAPGGALVYSVCSIEPEEGVMIVERFLENRVDFKRDGARGGAAEAADFVDGRGGFFALPGDGGMDGFHAARLVRKGS
ncbi:MAG: RsmB/NOP family class I SAM-dependent RNA methyltransferase [Candidatus Nitrospinota bacterium M3_3B_026]